MSRPAPRHAARLALAALLLAALAACWDSSPVGVRGYSATPDRSTQVQLYAGDSLYLASLASDRFGMVRVANCASTDPAVANVADADRLLALAEGVATIRCVGALDRRLDPSILTGEELMSDGAEENLLWVTFDVQLTVVPLDRSAGETAQRHNQ